ncbi:MAG: bifunctional folylpolyglutamate synthase/dihydrofolate synthase [Treponema sp.]
MKLSAFLDWLDGFLNFEKTQAKNVFWLESMRFLCARLGNPQDVVPCIHAAGSKGKGSVCALCASIVESAGMSCGLYLSPHVSDFRERITTPHGFFDDAVYEDAADELVEAVESIRNEDVPNGQAFTWFELATAFAFLCFRRARVDFAVYETGLGGRLDATNVVTPRACILMPIELEHTAFLGGTIEKIAAEKAGIIKDGVPVVIARHVNPQAARVFADCAERRHAPCVFADEDVKNLSYQYESNGMRIAFYSDRFDGGRVSALMKLRGAEQADNAAAAPLAVKIALPSVTAAQIQTGLEEAALPARFEIVSAPAQYGGVRRIILDGAHTPVSVRYAVQTLKDGFGAEDGVFHLLFACAKDKDAAGIAKELRGVFTEVTVTETSGGRARNADDLKTVFADAGIPCTAEKDARNALESALQKASAARASLLVAGSFYLAAETAAGLSR